MKELTVVFIVAGILCSTTIVSVMKIAGAVEVPWIKILLPLGVLVAIVIVYFITVLIAALLHAKERRKSYGR